MLLWRLNSLYPHATVIVSMKIFNKWSQIPFFIWWSLKTWYYKSTLVVFPCAWCAFSVPLKSNPIGCYLLGEVLEVASEAWVTSNRIFATDVVGPSNGPKTRNNQYQLWGFQAWVSQLLCSCWKRLQLSSHNRKLTRAVGNVWATCSICGGQLVWDSLWLYIRQKEVLQGVSLLHTGIDSLLHVYHIMQRFGFRVTATWGSFSAVRW